MSAADHSLPKTPSGKAEEMSHAPEGEPVAFGTRPWSWLSRCNARNAGEAVASPAPRTPLSKAGRRGARGWEQ